MAFVYYAVGAVVGFAVVLFLFLRKRQKPEEAKTFSFDDLSLSPNQKNKKRKHFGFSKSKNKKNSKEDEIAMLELLEKKGKKKGKGKSKASGKKKLPEKQDSHQDAESDKESAEAEEKEQLTDEADVEEQTDHEVEVKPAKKQQVSSQLVGKGQAKTASDATVSAGDLEKKAESEKKGKKNKPRRDTDEGTKKEILETTSKEAVKVDGEEKRKVVEEKHEVAVAALSQPLLAGKDLENGEKDEQVTTSSTKAAKKKKKKNKNAAVNGLPAAGVETPSAENDARDVAFAMKERPNEKVTTSTEDNDSEDGFVPVSRDSPRVAAVDNGKPAKDTVKKPIENELEKTLKSSLDAEQTKLKAVEEELVLERQQNAIFKQAVEQMAVQMKEKELKKIQLEHSFEQQSVELKTLQGQFKDSTALIQKLNEDNKALKEAVSKAQKHAVDEAQMIELQKRVRVMDDALQQNALQLNSIENARKDLDIREKRLLERNMILERELQATKAELAESRQNAEQRSQAMSADLQHLTMEMAQVEKMRSRFMEVENKKSELETVVKTLDTQHKEMMSYSRQKDADNQRLQSEISMLNETFQRRSREMEARISDRDTLAGQVEALRQQLCQKDTELQVLRQKEVEFVQLEAELQGLHQKQAEFVRLEAELQGIHQKQAEFVQLEAELQGLRQSQAEFARLEAELQGFHQKQAEFALLEAELQGLRQKETLFTQREAEFARQEAELRELRQKKEVFVQMESEFAQLKVRLEELTTAEATQSVLHDVEGRLSSSSVEIANLRQTETNLIQEVDRLKQELESRDIDFQNLEGMRDDMCDEARRLRSENEAKQHRISQLDADNRVLQDKIEQMKSDLLQRLADNDARLRGELEERDKEIERLTSQLTAKDFTTEVQNEKFSIDVHKPDTASQVDGEQLPSDAQSLDEVGRQ